MAKKKVATIQPWETWSRKDHVFFRQMFRALAIAFDAGCGDPATVDEIRALASAVRSYEAQHLLADRYDGEIRPPQHYDMPY